jgi:hypothetical protein
VRPENRERGKRLSSDSNHRYRVSGLKVRSQIALPELTPDDQENGEPDLEIGVGPVPESLPGSVMPMHEAEITEHDVLLKIPGVGRYLISAGRQILVATEPDVRPEDVRLFLLGSAFGAVYFQRGCLPLHASVVVIDGKGIAFTGNAGAGKSTMAAWMHARGYPLLCDDVCVIRFDGQGTPMAYPGFPRLKLWKDALSAFDIDTRALQPDYSRADKYHLPAAGQFGAEPVPLRHVNVLQFADDEAKPTIKVVPPAQSVHLLRDNTYRYQYISGLGLTRSHFLDCVRLARNTRVHYLVRPRRHSALAECQELVEQQLR